MNGSMPQEETSFVDGKDLKPARIPEPTFWPSILALGTVLFLWGILTSVLVSILGGIVFAIAMVEWIGDLRREQERKE
jgi:hypothetical protein